MNAAQIQKLITLLPDRVYSGTAGVCLRRFDGEYSGELVTYTQWDYLVKLAVRRLPQAARVSFLNKLRTALPQPASDYDLMAATPEQWVDAMPD